MPCGDPCTQAETASKTEVLLHCKRIEGFESDIVGGVVVFCAWISQTDNQLD